MIRSLERFQQRLSCLPLAEPVAQAIRGDDVEHLPRRVAAALDLEVGEFLLETVGLELRKQRLDIVHMERAAVLRRIATVFHEANLNVIASQDSRWMRRVRA